MKIVVTLILVILIVTGGIFVVKKFMAPAEKKAGNFVQQVTPVKDETEVRQAAPLQNTSAVESAAKPVRSAADPGDQNLSTANTPVAKSRIGRKINHIYSDHNKGLEAQAGADEKEE